MIYRVQTIDYPESVYTFGFFSTPERAIKEANKAYEEQDDCPYAGKAAIIVHGIPLDDTETLYTVVYKIGD
jgi:hypothetical protein